MFITWKQAWMMQITGGAAVATFVPRGLGLTSHCVGINNFPGSKLKPSFYFSFQKANLLIR